jgi:hypothetical protein
MDLKRHTPNEVRNGMGAPRVGGKRGDLCAKAWEVFYAAYACNVTDSGVIIAAGESFGLNPGNLKVELYYFRRFHDLPSAADLRKKAA